MESLSLLKVIFPFIPNNATHVAYGILTILILVGLSFLATRRLELYPGKLQNLMEVVVGALDNLITETMGEHGRKYFPLIATIGLFILVSNLMGLIPGFESTTANLNTNLCMALTIFFLTHIIGFKTHGIKYVKHFVGPSPWLAPLIIPIEIVSHLARPVSLTFRLFGNMAGGHIVLTVLVFLVPFLVPMPIMILKLLICFIQALVFVLLSMMYIAGAIEEAH